MTRTTYKRSRSPLPGAIIGFGNTAVNAHLPAFRKSTHFRIESVVESDAQRAALARKLLPDAQIFPDMTSLFQAANPVFVDICTPNSFHRQMVLSALDAGTHVLCEKPLATSFAGVEEIRSASKANEKVVYTVNNWKYAPLWLKARELARAGAIGEIRSIWLSVLRPNASGGGVSNWRQCPGIAGGGILLDHGWHNLYIILSLLTDRKPASVRARMIPNPHNGLAEQTADIHILFDSAAVHLHLTWQGPCRQNQGIIEGDQGSIRINDDHLILTGKNGNAEKFGFAKALSQSSNHPEWISKVLRSFYDELTDLTVRGENLKEAARCALLTHLAYISQAEGCEQHVNGLFGQP